jgi:acyl-CoA reductase-like NAD-dependent aldehyde dehydrogenase
LLHAPAIKDQLVAEMKKAVIAFFGQDARTSDSYGRIINERHFDRVVNLLKGGRVIFGGESDRRTKFIAPTFLDNVDLNSPLMTEEIFGPLLPLIPCNSADDAVQFINAREKPLAMYIFSQKKAAVDLLLNRTTSGGVTVNDALLHVSLTGLPFGGCGHSGLGGANHGKFGFDAFSHRKAVLHKNAGMEFVNDIRYPPYKQSNLNFLRMLLVSSGPKKNMFLYFCLGAVFTACFAVYFKHFRAGGMGWNGLQSSLKFWQ